jgi:2-oxoglutarate ferredoxin oxidoreductase subunit beta
MKPIEFNTGQKPVWCPGCGNFAIWNSIKKALSEAGVEAHKLALISGIGCSGKMINHIKAYGFHGLHGRTLPVATGIRLANPELKVLVNGGDGDGYGMGVGHFVHAMRRNVDITYVVHENKVYGLTTGQAAPTNEVGTATKSTPFGVVDEPMNPLALAIESGATYVARAFAGDSELLAELILGGLNHNGFALIDVLQPCVTFGGKFQYDYYQERVYKIENHDPENRDAALKLAHSSDDRIPTGLFYLNKGRTAYNELHPEISKVKVERRDVSKLLAEFV